jgi:hypothetical protein
MRPSQEILAFVGVRTFKLQDPPMVGLPNLIVLLSDTILKTGVLQVTLAASIG